MLLKNLPQSICNSLLASNISRTSYQTSHRLYQNRFTPFKCIFIKLPNKASSNFGKLLHHIPPTSKPCVQYTNHCSQYLLYNQDSIFYFSPLIPLSMFVCFPSRDTHKNSVPELNSFPNHGVWFCWDVSKFANKNASLRIVKPDGLMGKPSLKNTDFNRSSLPTKQSKIFHCFLLI